MAVSLDHFAMTLKVQKLMIASAKRYSDSERKNDVNFNTHGTGVDFKMLIYSFKMKNTYKNRNIHVGMSVVFSLYNHLEVYQSLCFLL